MNKILLAALILTLSGCKTLASIPAYDAPPPSRVVEVPNASASEIYEGSRQWIAENFRSANNVIQYQDTATNTVIGNGISGSMICTNFMTDKAYLKPPCTPLNTTANFTLKIEAKDGRMRLSVPNVSLSYPGTQYGPARTDPGNSISYPIVAEAVLDYGEGIRDYVLRGKSSSDF